MTSISGTGAGSALHGCLILTNEDSLGIYPNLECAHLFPKWSVSVWGFLVVFFSFKEYAKSI